MKILIVLDNFFATEPRSPRTSTTQRQTCTSQSVLWQRNFASCKLIGSKFSPKQWNYCQHGHAPSEKIAEPNLLNLQPPLQGMVQERAMGTPFARYISTQKAKAARRPRGHCSPEHQPYCRVQKGQWFPFTRGQCAPSFQLYGRASYAHGQGDPADWPFEACKWLLERAPWWQCTPWYQPVLQLVKIMRGGHSLLREIKGQHHMVEREHHQPSSAETHLPRCASGKNITPQ